MKLLLTPLLALPLLATTSISMPLEPGRSEDDKCPVFKLHDITYSSEMIFSTPAHLAVADATVTFNLTNTAVPYTTQCTGGSMQAFDFFPSYDQIVYQCTTPPGAPAGASANFTFVFLGGTFNVNQTWSSEDHNTKSFLGIGTGNATLTCSTSTYTNPNWVIGEIYSNTTTTCLPAELTIKPTVKCYEQGKPCGLRPGWSHREPQACQ